MMDFEWEAEIIWQSIVDNRELVAQYKAQEARALSQHPRKTQAVEEYGRPQARGNRKRGCE